MKMTDSHRRNLVEYVEALSIDENGEEDEDEKHHDETYICDHPGSGTGEVETTTRTPPAPLILLGATGTSGTSTSISISTVYKTSPQHAELPAPSAKRTHHVHHWEKESRTASIGAREQEEEVADFRSSRQRIFKV